MTTEDYALKALGQYLLQPEDQRSAKQRVPEFKPMRPKNETPKEFTFHVQPTASGWTVRGDDCSFDFAKSVQA